MGQWSNLTANFLSRSCRLILLVLAISTAVPFTVGINTAYAQTDTTPPTVTFDALTVPPVIGVRQNAHFTFSERITNFSQSDISVTGARRGSITGTGTRFQIPFTPTGGIFTVTIAAHSVTDRAGNTGPVNAVTLTGMVDQPQPAIRSVSYTSDDSGIRIHYTPLKAGEYRFNYGSASTVLTLRTANIGRDRNTFIDVGYGYDDVVIILFDGNEVARIHVTTKLDPTLPSTPITISVGKVTRTSIEILWEPRETAIGYFVHKNGQAQSNLHFTYNDLLAGGVNTGLTPGTTYEYYVNALYTDPLLSVRSNTLTVTTLKEPILTAERLPDNSVIVSVRNT